MICSPCTEGSHKYCENKWKPDPDNEGQLVKRDPPVERCFCQHKQSWNFKVSDRQKNKDNDGVGSQP